MVATVIVSALVDKNIRDEASAVLASMGLTASDLLQILLTRIAQDQALPFEHLIPNEATIAAMDEADEIVSARKAR